MSQNGLFTVLAVLGLLAAGGFIGYAVSQHDPSDSSSAIDEETMNGKLQKYAADLTTYGGKIATYNAALVVPMGTTVSVSEGDLVYVYSGSTYRIPYEGISYILVYHA